MSETLHFKVSSGLKNIIGKELINDKFIAILELVKNSYDAGAKKVRIQFEGTENGNLRIKITDDGKGMSKEDIINKWLFVAYSEKKNHSYRDNLRTRRNYAGAKGVGRFSCDRLGEEVQLFSKTKYDTITNFVSINWTDFEKTDTDEFHDIEVFYEEKTEALFASQGTIIVIDKLRELWDRNEFLKLKKALTQLVNPEATDNYDMFDVFLEVNSEKDEDERILMRSKEVHDKDIVNGKINNHVFEALNLKTTKIETEISEDGKYITTEFNDRGIRLFRIVEKNRYGLKNIKGSLYSLNRAAKVNFTKIMGIESVNYGSVFIYKNGFRVYPYGEPNRDFMDIDRRKAQGYNRFLGTREIVGRIDILGENRGFIETSSRNNGFIASFELEELEDFFYEFLLKPLEKYVYNIIHWGDEIVNLSALGESMQGYENFESILKAIKSRFKKDSLISAEYNPELAKIIDEKSNSKSEKELDDLKRIAIKKGDEELLIHAERVEKSANELKRIAEENIRIAHSEAQKLESVQKELVISQRQIGVLQSRVDVSADNAINAMHIMKAYADSIGSNIDEIFEQVRAGEGIEEITTLLHEIRQTCTKIMNAYNLVINTNYTAETGNKELDIVKFTKEYIEKQWSEKFKIHVNGVKEMFLEFNPLEFSIVIDNLIDNSKKANASNLEIVFDFKDGVNRIFFRDDGYGLGVDTDGERVFEQGYTTTKGTGIGLFTVKKYIDKMKGHMRVNSAFTGGFELIMSF